MEILKYGKEWSLLLLGIICSIISVYFDIHSIECTTWFARSGSIVVLVAAMVEYRLSEYVYDDVDQAAKDTARQIAILQHANKLVTANLTSKAKSPKSRLYLKNTSHFLIILGTIIWGYGDIWIS